MSFPPENGDCLISTPGSTCQTSGNLFKAAYPTQTAAAPELPVATATTLPESLPACTIDHNNAQQASNSLNAVDRVLYPKQSAPDQSHGVLALASFRSFYTAPLEAGKDIVSGDFGAVGNDLSAPFRDKYDALKDLL